MNFAKLLGSKLFWMHAIACVLIFYFGILLANFLFDWLRIEPVPVVALACLVMAFFGLRFAWLNADENYAQIALLGFVFCFVVFELIVLVLNFGSIVACKIPDWLFNEVSNAFLLALFLGVLVFPNVKWFKQRVWLLFATAKRKPFARVGARVVKCKPRLKPKRRR